MSKGVVFITSFVLSRRLNKAQQHFDSCVAKIYLRMVMFTLNKEETRRDAAPFTSCDVTMGTTAFVYAGSDFRFVPLGGPLQPLQNSSSQYFISMNFASNGQWKIEKAILGVSIYNTSE